MVSFSFRSIKRSGFKCFIGSEAERVAFLFERYQTLIAPLMQSQIKPGRKRGGMNESRT